MNSLYGRFGMNPNLESHAIIDNIEIDKYVDKYDVVDIKELNNDKILISYQDIETIENTKFLNHNYKNVSVPIASAITAYSRIFMSQFKNSTQYKIYYTDTDSLYVDKPLNHKFIGCKLGQFKLENTFTKAYFLGPKIYAGLTTSGQVISKIKGYKNKLNLNEFSELLNYNYKIELMQEK